MLKLNSLALFSVWFCLNQRKRSQPEYPSPNPKGAQVVWLYWFSPPTDPWHMSGYLLSTDYLFQFRYVRVLLMQLKSCSF